ncbi:MAG: Fe-S cluster assembly protein SufD [Cenarchaeum symbiont of Oopsacas minuta]|nr:Fe-S cluster assembly protein SufD [Cenarchaeum symbiont of Oopsacas minuta]
MVILSELDSKFVSSISSTKDESDWLCQYRTRSLEMYNKLPLETSSLYTKYTDAARLEPEKVKIAEKTDGVIPEFLQNRINELKDLPHIIQIGTNIHSIHLTPEVKESGVRICHIDDALADGTAKEIIESSDVSDDRFTALNAAAFNSGVYIGIPKNAQLSSPIHLLSCLSKDGISAIARNVISASENSSAIIVQEVYSPKSPEPQTYLELLTTDIQDGANLDITSLQMMDEDSINFSTRKTNMASDSVVNWYLGLFGAMLSRYRLEYNLKGSGASVNDSEVIFGNGEQSFDIQANANHISPATEARIIEKSILRNSSKSLFKGMIRILDKAVKSNSYLSGRSILLDADAKSDAIPSLEILTNDVKATHSASVAQIDEEQIFYLQSRCLTKAAAERTIIEGFLEPLSRKMSYQVRAWIAYLIESKWEGRSLSINNDEELRKFVEVEETRYNEKAEIEQHYKYR